jgi:hypothetical protein
LFIRPAYCHYYFGDYYGPRYVGLGFETCVVYSRRHYEPIIAYRTWENRSNPAWINVQINLASARNEGRAPLPPRTLVQQTNITNVTNVTNVKNVTNISNTTVLASTKTVAAARGQKTVSLPPAARTQAMQSARNVQLAAVQQRQKTEIPSTAGQMAKPRTASLNVPPLPGKSAPPPGGNTVNNSKLPINNTPAGIKGTNTPLPGHNPTGPPTGTGPGNPPPKGPMPKGPPPKGPAHKPPPKKDH